MALMPELSICSRSAMLSNNLRTPPAANFFRYLASVSLSLPLMVDLPRRSTTRISPDSRIEICRPTLGSYPLDVTPLEPLFARRNPDAARNQFGLDYQIAAQGFLGV